MFKKFLFNSLFFTFYVNIKMLLISSFEKSLIKSKIWSLVYSKKKVILFTLLKKITLFFLGFFCRIFIYFLHIIDLGLQSVHFKQNKI